MLLAINQTLALHRTVDHFVEILPGPIVRRNDKCRVRIFHVFVWDRRVPRADRSREPDPDGRAVRQRFVPPRGQLIDDRLRARILLPYDLVKMGGTDSRLL